VEVVVEGDTLAEATGASKKEAEQEAARVALEKLRIEN
jgi:dsRNA-specific ribonuclease